MADVATIATFQAGQALSRLSGMSLTAAPPEVTVHSVGRIPDLWGRLDEPAVGVLVPFHGDIQGNILILFPREGLSKLEKNLFPATQAPPEDLRLSAFAEVGNILSGALLTALASLSERVLLSDPPLLVQDMLGALIDTMLADAGALSDEMATLVFALKDGAGEELVRSVLIPGPSGVELLLEAAERLRSDE